VLASVTVFCHFCRLQFLSSHIISHNLVSLNSIYWMWLNIILHSVICWLYIFICIPMTYLWRKAFSLWALELQGRFSGGIHELSKVLLKPAMPYHSTPCRRPPLKKRFQGRPPAGLYWLLLYYALKRLNALGCSDFIFLRANPIGQPWSCRSRNGRSQASFLPIEWY
jgi:Zn-dependent protease with chaperone function